MVGLKAAAAFNTTNFLNDNISETNVEPTAGNIGLDGLTMLAGYGRYYKQDAKNFVLNKYGIPSYAQMDIDFFYKFKGSLKGL